MCSQLLLRQLVWIEFIIFYFECKTIANYLNVAAKIIFKISNFMKMINEFTMCPEIQLFSVHNKNSEKLLSLCLPVFPHCHTYISSSIILSFQFSIQRWKAEERLAILLQSVYGTREISIPYIIILFKIEFSKSWNIGLRTKQCYWSFTFRDKWLRWWPAHVRMLNVLQNDCVVHSIDFAD